MCLVINVISLDLGLLCVCVCVYIYIYVFVCYVLYMIESVYIYILIGDYIYICNIVYYIVHQHWIFYKMKKNQKKKICYMLRFLWNRSIQCTFVLWFKTAAFKIGYLLLSLMVGVKTAAYCGKKTAAYGIFSTSEYAGYYEHVSSFSMKFLPCFYYF